MSMNLVHEKDNAITESSIQNRAQECRFYLLSSHDWKTVGRLEWLLRTIFSKLTSYVYSAKQICIQRSWESIENMPESPIRKTIEKHFDDSRSPTHYLNPAARSITAIYFEKLVESPDSLQIKVKEDPKQRFFKLYENGKRSATAVSSGWGQIDFYGTDNKLTTRNRLDALYDAGNNDLIAEVIIKSDHVSWNKIKSTTQIDIRLKTGTPLAKVEAEGNPTTFVFRDPVTNKKLALAVWSPKVTEQKWFVVFISDPTPERKYLFTWALLKHSQKHLSSTETKPYIRNWLFN